MKKLLSFVLVLTMLMSLVSLSAIAEEPLKISLYYSDNATLPFQEDWLTVQTLSEKFNVDLQFEIIPIPDYDTKVSTALNIGGNTTPDVILYQYMTGENAALALNGAIVPISDYSEWTPNFNARVEEFGLQEAVDRVRLADGKLYHMPSLYDVPFYDGGLILREDFLVANGLEAPKTYDDLYEILKAYKAENPDSYPLTILAGPRVLYRMTMPAFGVSLGRNSSSNSNTLSWNYEEGTYFPGAISEEYKAYITFFAKLFEEGLLDPEMADPIDGDRWTQKMANGSSMATYAYYDQIGGVEAASEIDGIKLNMYPSLEGPAGAHHQPKNAVGDRGIILPAKTASRPDFEQVVRAIDELFFSEEAAKIWCLGVEGVTYTEENGTIVYADELVNSPDGVYKTLQVKYGCGADVTQLVWYNAREMTKYDQNYSDINAAVAAMDGVIQPIPPAPLFDDLTAEDAAMLRTPLADAWEVWNDAFLTGKKSIDTDWDAYVQEMQDKGIEELCEFFNNNLAK